MLSLSFEIRDSMDPSQGAREFFRSRPSKGDMLKLFKKRGEKNCLKFQSKRKKTNKQTVPREVEDIWKLLEFQLWAHQDKEQHERLFEWLKELASGGQGFDDTFLKNQKMGVCGKEIKGKEPVYKCNTCAADSTCIQCVECFENSDHTGHDVKRMFASGGCCDCGDPESWAPKGFCKFHQGPDAAAKNIG
ncbi:hypothetical protein RFI_21440 [Reticulomyxa filosa]|uniref:E3 ubiquitin-protein ligase n=1 Tax=Reticulomyxa filosa TaxID=46433 RepID=X6MS76_RETFI|nr:hypothetical protein RFI_21440 [Reticulomyxa filosa]|eukprot:ETO15925.1 hypothetical protein RFI_21440 [Reticulomyxa filosa]